MNNMITAEVAAEKWGVTKRRVNQLCSSGKIPGAIKEGQSWVIPANAQRPIDKLDEISDWYDGYCFGDTEIFNPWSVINYFSQGCTPRAFWQSTGSNDIISEVIENADEDIYYRLEKLLQGGKFPALIDTGEIYPQIKNNPATIYSFLLVAGYLKAENAVISSNGNYVCEVSLPNKEIRTVCNKEILQKFSNYGIQSSAALIQEAIYSNDTKKLKTALHSLLLKSSSCFDTTKELFFHGLLLGIYDTEMKRRGITTVIKYGVTFSGKNVEICTE